MNERTKAGSATHIPAASQGRISDLQANAECTDSPSVIGQSENRSVLISMTLSYEDCLDALFCGVIPLEPIEFEAFVERFFTEFEKHPLYETVTGSPEADRKFLARLIKGGYFSGECQAQIAERGDPVTPLFHIFRT